MQVEIIIKADQSALEFSRNLGGIANFFEEALTTNALEEKGISARNICDEQNQKVVIPVVNTANPENYTMVSEPKVQTIEPDPILPEVSEPEQQAVTADELQNLCLDLGNRFGKAAFTELKAKAGFKSMKALDANGRTSFAAMIKQYMQEHA